MTTVVISSSIPSTSPIQSITTLLQQNNNHDGYTKIMNICKSIYGTININNYKNNNNNNGNINNKYVYSYFYY